MCLLLLWSVGQKDDIVKAATGRRTTAFELLQVSERVMTLARVFNLREGFTREDDWLPPRFFTPTTHGALSDAVVKGVKFRAPTATYYEMMGWDKQGVPTLGLKELDVGWAAHELDRL